jgi:quercetin dioxygenase-like cupin family protein
VRPELAEPTISPELLARVFIGIPTVRQVNRALGTDQVELNAVYFEAGSRSRPHAHSHDQILFYVSGEGVVALDGGEDEIIEAREFVVLPAGVPHMHGASDAGPAMHLSIMPPGHDNDFECPIPDAWRTWRD